MDKWERWRRKAVFVLWREADLETWQWWQLWERTEVCVARVVVQCGWWGIVSSLELMQMHSAHKHAAWLQHRSGSRPRCWPRWGMIHFLHWTSSEDHVSVSDPDVFRGIVDIHDPCYHLRPHGHLLSMLQPEAMLMSVSCGATGAYINVSGPSCHLRLWCYPGLGCFWGPHLGLWFYSSQGLCWFWCPMLTTEGYMDVHSLCNNLKLYRYPRAMLLWGWGVVWRKRTREAHRCPLPDRGRENKDKIATQCNINNESDNQSAEGLALSILYLLSFGQEMFEICLACLLSCLSISFWLQVHREGLLRDGNPGPWNITLKSIDFI